MQLHNPHTTGTPLMQETLTHIRRTHRYLHKSVVEPLKDQVPRMINYYLLTETDRGNEALFSSLSAKFDQWLIEKVTSKPEDEQDKILREYMRDEDKVVRDWAEDDMQIVSLQDCLKVIQRVLDDAHM